MYPGIYDCLIDEDKMKAADASLTRKDMEEIVNSRCSIKMPIHLDHL